MGPKCPALPMDRLEVVRRIPCWEMGTMSRDCIYWQPVIFSRKLKTIPKSKPGFLFMKSTAENSTTSSTKKIFFMQGIYTINLGKTPKATLISWDFHKQKFKVHKI
jgi:hypothetical protein